MAMIFEDDGGDQYADADKRNSILKLVTNQAGTTSTASVVLGMQANADEPFLKVLLSCM